MKTKQKQNMFMNNLLFVVSIEKLKYIREQNRFYLKIQKHDYTHTHTHTDTHMPYEQLQLTLIQMNKYELIYFILLY